MVNISVTENTANLVVKQYIRHLDGMQCLLLLRVDIFFDYLTKLVKKYFSIQVLCFLILLEVRGFSIFKETIIDQFRTLSCRWFKWL